MLTPSSKNYLDKAPPTFRASPGAFFLGMAMASTRSLNSAPPS